LTAYLGQIDVVVLTSLSEAQPLVILEAGAAGVPVVATDVGACSEMILGHANEEPRLGPGGAITLLCNPSATAREVSKLLTDRAWHTQCANALRERVRLHYDKRSLDRTYREIYDKYGKAKKQWPVSVLNSAN
jgi:glycosyltransferase involved in cell wall biosynthesis